MTTPHPSPGIITLDQGDVEGIPEHNQLAQWRPGEEHPWCTEKALVVQGGLVPDWITGIFLAPIQGAFGSWTFRVLRDNERTVELRRRKCAAT
jgi:hypothetical protein